MSFLSKLSGVASELKTGRSLDQLLARNRCFNFFPLIMEKLIISTRLFSLLGITSLFRCHLSSYFRHCLSSYWHYFFKILFPDDIFGLHFQRNTKNAKTLFLPPKPNFISGLQAIILDKSG